MDVSIKCICPPKADGKPQHEQDTVTLPDRLPFRQLIAIRHSLAMAMNGPGVTQADLVGALVEIYVVTTPVAWTIVDEAGKPVPLSRDAIEERLLTNYEAAEAVGEAADALYSEVVTLPLLTRASTSSPVTPTPASTSRTTGRGTTRPKPSKRSSTSTSPMVVTGPMAASPAGVSSSSAS